jgi:polyhydroxyalkanoate synthase subunit PhaC
MSVIRNKFDMNFREEGFTRALCEYIDSYSDIAIMTYAGQSYQYTSNFTSLWNNKFIEPVRDTILRTPSHKIYSENKYSLFIMIYERSLIDIGSFRLYKTVFNIE